MSHADASRVPIHAGELGAVVQVLARYVCTLAVEVGDLRGELAGRPARTAAEREAAYEAIARDLSAEIARALEPAGASESKG